MFFVFDTHDEEEMFYYLYERYNRLLYKYARDILSDESDIEDVLRISEENVGVRIFRAREKVRKFISKGGDLSD